MNHILEYKHIISLKKITRHSKTCGATEGPDSLCNAKSSASEQSERMEETQTPKTMQQRQAVDIPHMDCFKTSG